MKSSIQYLTVVAAGIFAAAIFAISIDAQAPPQNTVQTGTPPPPNSAVPTPGRPHLSAPRNLQVLPKDANLLDIMQQWEGALGVTCFECHSDHKVRDQYGNIHPDLADDSRPEYKATRSMYRMTEEMNSKYMASVTCGTCHRGHMIPEPFTRKGPLEAGETNHKQ
jgi:hypothetical protein